MKKLLMMSLVLLTLSACSFQQAEEKKQDKVTTKNTTEQGQNSEIKQDNEKNTTEDTAIKSADDLFKQKEVVYGKYTIKADRNTDNSIDIYYNNKKIKTINESF